MSATDMLVDEIANKVVERLQLHMKQPQTVLPEEDVMQMLGVKDKGTMRELRDKGLVGHRINYRSWVYLAKDVEAFVESCQDY